MITLVALWDIWIAILFQVDIEGEEFALIVLVKQIMTESNPTREVVVEISS